MYQHSTNTEDPEIAQLQALAGEESDMINRWYQFRYNHLMEELDRLNEVYNERMAHHSVQWAERLTKLYMEKEIQRMNVEESGMYSQNNMLLIQVLERHPNIIFPQETGDNFIQQPFVPSILGLNTMAIVSDDDDDDACDSLLMQNPFHNPVDTNNPANMADLMEIDDDNSVNEESNAMEIV